MLSQQHMIDSAWKTIREILVDRPWIEIFSAMMNAIQIIRAAKR
jgi:hypothetical protein